MHKMPILGRPANRQWKRKAALYSACCLSAFIAAPASAANYDYPDYQSGQTAQIRLTQVGLWDSNPLMQKSGAESLYGSQTTPQLVFRGNTPNARYSLDTSLVQNLYNDKAFNSTDFHGMGNVTRSGERWSIGLKGGIDLDTTRSSELSTFGLNLKKVNHKGYKLAPVINIKESQRGNIVLSGSYDISEYDNSAYRDYHAYSLSPGYKIKTDENNTWDITLSARRYETTEGPEFTSDTIGPSIGWSTVLSPTLVSRFSLGLQNNRQESTTTPTSSKLTYNFYGDIAYRGVQDTVRFSAKRSQQPFGTAREALLTTFTVTERHSINHNLFIDASGTYQFAEYSNTPGVNLDKQWKANAGITYRLTHSLDVNASYYYRAEELTNVSGTINGNSVIVGITYHPEADEM